MKTDAWCMTSLWQYKQCHFINLDKIDIFCNNKFFNGIKLMEKMKYSGDQDNEICALWKYIDNRNDLVRLYMWTSDAKPVSSTNKTDCHDITELLLKMVLNTITLTL